MTFNRKKPHTHKSFDQCFNDNCNYVNNLNKELLWGCIPTSLRHTCTTWDDHSMAGLPLLFTCSSCLVLCKFQKSPLFKNKASSDEQTGTDGQRQTNIKIPDLFFRGCERHCLIAQVRHVCSIVQGNFPRHIQHGRHASWLQGKSRDKKWNITLREIKITA